MGETLLLERRAVVQRGKRLEYFTIARNAAEGLTATAAGLIAGSISLVGFGIDSFIEVTSASGLLWRLSVDADEQRRASHEKRAPRFVGACFLMLASYVAFESAMDLLTRRAPEHSSAGIILACASFVVMTLLSKAKRKVGRALGIAAMHADAKQSEFCMYLSAILLLGLSLNAFFNLWWADPVAALIMVPVIGKEGIQGLQGKPCSGTPCE